MAKKKPIKKRRKSPRPTQKQSQKQIVNINFPEKKKRRKSTGVKKNNLQLAVQSLSSNLNMFSSDTQRLNNLENLIGELRKEQRQLITIGRPTPTAISTATASIDTQTEPSLKLKKTKKTQTRIPTLETPEPIKLKVKKKVEIPKRKRNPYQTKGKKADLFYQEGLMRKAMEGFRLTDTQEDDDLLRAEIDEPLGAGGGYSVIPSPKERFRKEQKLRAEQEAEFIKQEKKQERQRELLGAEEM